MSRSEQLAQMKARLAQAGLGFEDLKVFGAINVNVHVLCISRETAAKWQTLLTTVFGKPAKALPYSWDAKVNKGTCLLPTKRDGYLVAVAA